MNFGVIRTTPRGADRGYAPRERGAKTHDWSRAKPRQGRIRPGSTRQR